jgi:hypothetical protein
MPAMVFIKVMFTVMRLKITKAIPVPKNHGGATEVPALKLFLNSCEKPDLIFRKKPLLAKRLVIKKDNNPLPKIPAALFNMFPPRPPLANVSQDKNFMDDELTPKTGKSTRKTHNAPVMSAGISLLLSLKTFLILVKRLLTPLLKVLKKLWLTATVSGAIAPGRYNSPFPAFELFDTAFVFIEFFMTEPSKYYKLSI